MEDAEARRENEESLQYLVGRTIVKAELSLLPDREQAYGVSLEFDDGSSARIDALRFGGVEVGWVSPEEAFEFERRAMEEGALEGPDD